MMRFLFGPSCSHFMVVGCSVATVELSRGHWIVAAAICLIGASVDSIAAHYTERERA